MCVEIDRDKTGTMQVGGRTVADSRPNSKASFAWTNVAANNARALRERIANIEKDTHIKPVLVQRPR